MNELNREPKTARKHRIQKTLILAIVLTSIIVLTVGGLCLYVRNNTADRKDQEYAEKIAELENKIKELTDNPIVIEPITPEIDLVIIDTKLQSIGELATMEYLYTDSNRFSDAKKFLGLTVAKKSFIVKWDGVIKAGFNVDEITTAIDTQAKCITVYLPDPHILSHEILQDSVETLDEDRGLFYPIKVDDVNTLYAAGKDAMEKRAKENGIFLKAIDNAKEIITNIITSSPGVTDEYTINFQLVY